MEYMCQNHQPCQVPTLSQHDHIHLSSNHALCEAHLAPPNQDLHITTVTFHSPLSGFDCHDLQSHLSLLLRKDSRSRSSSPLLIPGLLEERYKPVNPQVKSVVELFPCST